MTDPDVPEISTRFRFGMRLYFAAALVVGGWLGLENGGGLPGALAGLFLGLLIGVAAFYCFAVLLTLVPRRGTREGE
ncbi:MAG: hypothetical protein AAFU73_01030 [Planctomycetota bacterium]